MTIDDVGICAPQTLELPTDIKTEESAVFPFEDGAQNDAFGAGSPFKHLAEHARALGFPEPITSST